MPRLATLDDLTRLTMTVRLPALSEEVGEDVTVTIRKLSQREYFACLPALPEGADKWTPETADAERKAWVARLSDEERADLMMAEAQSTYRVVAAGLVEPELTWRQVARFGADADIIAVAILRLSKWIITPTPNGTPAAEPLPDAA